MPALLKTNFSGVITWLGRVPDREAALQSEPLAQLMASFAGPEGEAHGGLTRPACSRVSTQYKRDLPIRNVRQFSILSAEDLTDIGAEMGLDGPLPAELVGASMVISGIPDFTMIPPSSRLQAKGGATLVVDMENRPCTLPAKPIQARFPGFGAKFKRAAVGRRGVTAWVEAEGLLKVGQTITLHIPDQPVWPHLDAARAG